MKRKRLTKEQVDKIVKMKAVGFPIATIARKVGCSRQTVYNILDSYLTSV